MFSSKVKNLREERERESEEIYLSMNLERVAHLTLHDGCLARLRLDLGDAEIAQGRDACRTVDVFPSSRVFDFTVTVIGRHDAL